MTTTLNLTENPEVVEWPETHYVYVEKIGPFMDTAGPAWQTAHILVPAISEHNTVTKYMSLYQRGPQVYRAGFALAEAPENLPAGLEYTHFHGGKYARFVLVGPYSDLAAASGRVFEIVAEKNISLRDDFCIENYVTDPRTTPEDQTTTHILVPTA